MLVSDSLTHFCLVNLIDVTLAVAGCVTVADISDEDHVGNSLLPIWKLRFGHNVNFCSDFEHKVWSRF